MTTISAQLAGLCAAENGAAGGGAAAEGGDAASLSSVGGLVADSEVRLEQDAVETQPRPPVEERGASEAAAVGAAARRVLDDLVWPPLPIAAPPRPSPARVARCAVQSSGPSASQCAGAAAGGGEKTSPPPAVGAVGPVQQRAKRKGQAAAALLLRPSQPRRSRAALPAAPPPTAQLQCRSAVSPAGPGAAVNGGAAAGSGEETAPPPGVGATGSVQQRAERKERKGQVMDPARQCPACQKWAFFWDQHRSNGRMRRKAKVPLSSAENWPRDVSLLFSGAFL
jgi:hypothetical protein